MRLASSELSIFMVIRFGEMALRFVGLVVRCAYGMEVGLEHKRISAAVVYAGNNGRCRTNHVERMLNTLLSIAWATLPPLRLVSPVGC